MREHEMNVRNCIVLISLTAAVFIHSMPVVYAQVTPPSGDFRRSRPESRYGEKRPVTSIEEAKKVLNEYFTEKPIRIGEIKEDKLFFEAEILDKNNEPVDKVIIDKRTGRIRSIY
jgi:hypothetical protein